ncbi:MAG: HD domain-containing protein [Solirubrobacterales bacterium]
MPSSPRIEAIAERSELVFDALAAAREAHHGQIRNGSGGMPYIDHPVAVAELLAAHDFPEEVLAAALLHDVVEESETEVGEIRARFGGRVGDLVAALTDPEEIRPYEQRKDAHRSRVKQAGPDALAIYAADKLANLRALRRVYASEGEAVGAELKAPLEVKLKVWEADLAMLRSEAPELPFLGELADQLTGLRADRARAGAPSA